MTNDLENMTQDKWDAMTPAQRDKARDRSDLHPLLSTYIGRKIRVHPRREHGASTFRVGITTGWRPALLAVRGNAHGSSDIIGAGEVFTRIDTL